QEPFPTRTCRHVGDSFARWRPCLDARLVNAGMRRASAARLLREESVTSIAGRPPGDSEEILRARAGPVAWGTNRQKLFRIPWNCWQRRGKSLLPEAAARGALPVLTNSAGDLT